MAALLSISPAGPGVLTYRSLPPAFIVTAGFDPLRDEGQAYAERLRGAGVPVQLEHYPGMIHAFWQLGGVLDQGREVVAQAGAALAAAFRSAVSA